MGARGAGLAYCPGSNMFLGDGITRIPEMLRAGVRIGLGTDGGCTNNRLSVFDEMRTCSLLQRVRLLDGTALSAETAFALGTRTAAGLLRLEAGTIAPGQLADLVAIDLGHLSLQPAQRSAEERRLRHVAAGGHRRVGPRPPRRRGRTTDDDLRGGRGGSRGRAHEGLGDLSALVLDGGPLALGDVEDVARRRREVALAPGVAERLAHGRAFIDRLAGGAEPIYGITTGVGKLKDVVIPPAERAALQRNLVLSHAGGVGPALAEAETRALMLLLAASLARGASGVRPSVVETLVACLNRAVHPVVPEQGSVGSSGDLAPLAHVAACLIGEGEAMSDGRRVPAARGAAGRRRAAAGARDQGRTGAAQRHASHGGAGRAGRARRRPARAAGRRGRRHVAGSADGHQRGVRRAHPRAAAAPRRSRRWPRNLRRLTAASGIIESHRDCTRVQDAYSLRCMPQVHGSARAAFDFAGGVLERELGAVSDNPLVFADGRRRAERRQLPRRGAGAGARHAGDGPGPARRHQRAADRPAGEPAHQRGAAAVPGAQRRRQLRLHDRAVHGGGAGRRAAHAGPSGQRGLDSRPPGLQEDYNAMGGGRGAQGAAGRRRGPSGAGHRAPAGRAGPRPARAARAGPGQRAPPATPSAGASRRSRPTAISRPTSTPRWRSPRTAPW